MEQQKVTLICPKFRNNTTVHNCHLHHQIVNEGQDIKFLKMISLNQENLFCIKIRLLYKFNHL
ncbi:unnamed protein product [Paramecium sonneborni]|uniref:Uncharacterized protein n=1 Tax=Paramecium sonneborni TaxID=65129 RepID=A0A8S1JSK3_9CILI|nr:unnamed protein product [Paramecium sonneborni]